MYSKRNSAAASCFFVPGCNVCWIPASAFYSCHTLINHLYISRTWLDLCAEYSITVSRWIKAIDPDYLIWFIYYINSLDCSVLIYLFTIAFIYSMERHSLHRSSLLSAILPLITAFGVFSIVVCMLISTSYSNQGPRQIFFVNYELWSYCYTQRQRIYRWSHYFLFVLGLSSAHSSITQQTHCLDSHLQQCQKYCLA